MPCIPLLRRSLIISGSILLFGGLPAWTTETAAAPEYTLSVSTNRPTAIYRQEDEVTFKIQLLHREQPANGATVRWKISKDGVAPIREGTVEVQGGTATVSGSLDEPGFLQCHVELVKDAPGGSKVTAKAGAGIDPLAIEPSLPVPDDFDAFWAAKKEALAAVPVNARLTPVESSDPQVEVFDLQADSVGAPVSAYFARPAGAQPKSLPAILTVHGAGVGSSRLNAATTWAKEGMLAMDMNAHGLPNGKPDEFYEALKTGDLKDYRVRGRTSRDEFYFLGMFLRLVRAIDFLTSQPEWDGRTLVVYGSSQGGAQAIAAAGLDARVSFFVAGVPAMCDMSGAVVNRISGWPKLVPIDSEGKPHARTLRAARYFDAMNFVTRTKAPGFFTVGFIDETCPPTSVYATYNNLASEKQIFNDIKAGHTNTKEAQRRMRGAVLDHVASQKQTR